MAPVSQGQIFSHFCIEMGPTFICHILVDDREETKRGQEVIRLGPLPFFFCDPADQTWDFMRTRQMLYH